MECANLDRLQVFQHSKRAFEIADMEMQSLIKRGLRQSAFVGDEAFFLAFFATHDLSAQRLHMTLRKSGETIGFEELKENNLGRIALGRDFYNALNKRGMADPVEAAGSITRLVLKNIISSFEAQNLRDKIGANVPAKLMPSNMAIGPCERATEEGSRSNLTLADAGPLPFDDCTHPDQCACLYTIDHERSMAEW